MLKECLIPMDIPKNMVDFLSRGYILESYIIRFINSAGKILAIRVMVLGIRCQ